MITREMRQTICQQIGAGNILNISGGRVIPSLAPPSWPLLPWLGVGE